MSAREDRSLLERLIPDGDDPWEHSQEGVDDRCHYCGEWHYDWSSKGPTTYCHAADCVWLEAMEYLGRSFDTFSTHVRIKKSENDCG